MPFVLDASVAAAWFLPDEATPAADLLLTRIASDPAMAPSLFRHEMRNLLLSAERSRRLTSAQVDEALELLGTLSIIDRGSGVEADVVRLARKHRLTGYDATYLALAITERTALATFDKTLQTAAAGEGIALLPESESLESGRTRQ